MITIFVVFSCSVDFLKNHILLAEDHRDGDGLVGLQRLRNQIRSIDLITDRKINIDRIELLELRMSE